MADSTGRSRLLAVGDHHVRKAAPRWPECERIHGFILGQIRELRPDVFVSVGDLYDSSSTPDDRAYMVDWVTQAAEECEIVFVKGNHDRYLDLSIFSRLHTRYPVHVQEDVGMYRVGGMQIAAMAWPDRIDVAGRLGISKGIADLDERLRAHVGERLEKIHTQWDPDCARILAGHFSVSGAVTSAGQPMKGGEINIGIADLVRARAQFVVMGHIHCPQDWMYGDVPVVYTGSPFRTAFGEAEEKGIVLADFAGGKLESWRRIPTPATPMVLVGGYWDAEAQTLNGDVAAIRPEEVRGAEIRIRYEIDDDTRVTARAAAERLCQQLLEAGAVAVKIEDPVRPSVTARVPEIAEAHGLEAKLRLFWKARAQELPAERIARLIYQAHRLETELGIVSSASESRYGVPRFEAITARGFDAFPDEVSFDFTALDPQAPLIAICGENGAGKSTFLGLLYAAIYREFPGDDQGTLASRATADNAFLSVRAASGPRVLTFEQSVRGRNGDGTTIIRGVDGAPLYRSTKVSDGDRWVAEEMPDPDIVKTSTFGAQGTLGLVNLKPTARRAALLRALGLERYERLSKAAGEHGRVVKAEVGTLDARIADEQARAGDLPTLQDDLALQRGRIESSQRAVAAAREAHRLAQAAESDAAESIRQFNERLDRARELRARATDLEGAAPKPRDGTALDLEERLRNNRMVLDREDEIRAAAERDRDFAQRIQAQRDAKVACDADASGMAERERLIGKRRDDARGARDRLVRSLEEARRRAGGKDVAMRAKEGIPALTAAASEATTALRQAEGDLDSLSGQRLEGADDRIEGLRRGHRDVLASSDLDVAHTVANAALSADDKVVKHAEDMPARVQRAKDLVAATRATETKSKDALRRAEQDAGRLPDIEKAETEAAGFASELEAANASVADLEKELAQAARDRSAASDRGVALSGEIAGLEAERAPLAELVQYVERIATARARVEELEPRLATVREEIGKLRAEATQVHPEGAAPEAPDLHKTQRGVEDAERSDRELHTAIGVLEGKIEDTRAALERIAALEEERRVAYEEMEDWTRLSIDLGSKGIQALEVDAAGPEISTLATDLLHSSYGTRFSLKLVTAREVGAKSKEIEDCEILVLDSESPQPDVWRPVKTFSGGEKIFLSEALSLGLTVYRCLRSGSERPTLVRDETAGNLDVVKASAWIEMWRRAAKRVNADRVLIVTHLPALQAECDLRLAIGGGRIELVA